MNEADKAQSDMLADPEYQDNFQRSFKHARSGCPEYLRFIDELEELVKQMESHLNSCNYDKGV